MTQPTKPAMTHIVTAYNPRHPPGSGRLIEISRDNTTRQVRFVVVEVHKGIGEHVTIYRYEDDAIKHATELGYTDHVPA